MSTEVLFSLFPSYHLVGGDDLTKDIGERPLRLQGGVVIPKFKQQQGRPLWSSHSGAQSQNALHQIRDCRHSTQLPEHCYRVLMKSEKKKEKMDKRKNEHVSFFSFYDCDEK